MWEINSCVWKPLLSHSTVVFSILGWRLNYNEQELGINQLSCLCVLSLWKFSCLPFLGVSIWLLIRRQFNNELTGLSMIEVVWSLWWALGIQHKYLHRQTEAQCRGPPILDLPLPGIGWVDDPWPEASSFYAFSHSKMRSVLVSYLVCLLN